MAVMARIVFSCDAQPAPCLFIVLYSMGVCVHFYMATHMIGICVILLFLFNIQMFFFWHSIIIQMFFDIVFWHCFCMFCAWIYCVLCMVFIIVFDMFLFSMFYYCFRYFVIVFDIHFLIFTAFSMICMISEGIYTFLRRCFCLRVIFEFFFSRIFQVFLLLFWYILFHLFICALVYEKFGHWFRKYVHCLREIIGRTQLLHCFYYLKN